jgi:hypothetical protein
MGVYLMGMHLICLHLIGMYFMGVDLMGAYISYDNRELCKKPAPGKTSLSAPAFKCRKLADIALGS